MKQHILVAGIPRSGSTWIANMLTTNQHLQYIHEPDNERHTYTAYYYKRNLPRFPVLFPGDQDEQYYQLFYHAFFRPYTGMGSVPNELLFKLTRFKKERVEQQLATHQVNRSQRWYPAMLLYPWLPKETNQKKTRLVKSVHCILSMEYLISRLSIRSVVIIRHPASVVSSCLQMQNPDLDRKIYQNTRLMKTLFGEDLPDTSALTTAEAWAGYQVAIFYKVIARLIERHPNIPLIIYEDFCVDTVTKAQDLFDSLQLPFTAEVEAFIHKNNIPGDGYNTQRIAAQQVDVWKKRLSPAQITEIHKGYTCMAPTYYKDFSPVSMPA